MATVQTALHQLQDLAQGTDQVPSLQFTLARLGSMGMMVAVQCSPRLMHDAVSSPSEFIPCISPVTALPVAFGDQEFGIVPVWSSTRAQTRMKPQPQSKTGGTIGV